MKKENIIIRVLALSLCIIMLAFSFASCTAGDKIKTGVSDAWEKVKDGAEDIYNSVTDKSTGDIELDPISSAHIRLASLETSTASADASYKTTLTANDFANCTVATNGVGANYVTYEQYVGSITAVTGAEQADYWTATAGDKPIVAVDGNMSRVCVVLPSGFTDVATWAASAIDFSVTVSPVMVKELVATVLPESATNKAVEWSVSVETNPDEFEIDPADYIRILTFEGLWENRVQVLALAPFPGIEFKITCTTVVGGYTAECLVTYNGYPTFVHFQQGGNDLELMNGKAVFAFDSRHEIDIKGGNCFNLVGESFEDYELVEYGGVGNILVEYKQFNIKGGDIKEGTYELGVGYVDRDNYIDELGEFIRGVEVNGNQLVLKLNKAPQGYYKSKTNSDGLCTIVKYKSGAENVCFYVTIRHKASGEKFTLNFTIDPVVESIDLSTAKVVF